MLPPPSSGQALAWGEVFPYATLARARSSVVMDHVPLRIHFMPTKFTHWLASLFEFVS